MREGLHKIVSADETIVAIATPLGRSGIGVVRMSGSAAVEIARRFFRPSAALEHRVATVGAWTANDGTLVDEVVVTCFLAPHSYTGEDVVEISAHGNPFILSRLVETARGSGARLATPGEFTLRAVAHGKMDLIQAEAVREFIDAQTEQQARTALRQMEGSISKRLRPSKDTLLDVVAYLEAGIDFAEDDVDVPGNAILIERLRHLTRALEELQQTFGYGKLLSGGLRLAILGKPNVGKSSLFNRLVAADRAIVTDIPGTTRDVLTETVNLDGVPLRIADTAGIRETVDLVENLGVSRTFDVLSDADLALVVLDAASTFDSNDANVLEKSKALRRLIVLNKTDLPQTISLASLNGSHVVRASAATGEGMEDLRAAIRAFVVDQKSDLTDDLILTNTRQNEALLRAIGALGAAAAALDENVPHEMVLLDLYSALAALGELTGEVVTEDILGRIFSTFCIGK